MHIYTSRITSYLRYRLINFSGRATRKEFYLSFLVLTILLALVITSLVMNILPPELLPTILLLFYVPFLALQIRRLHDTDRSGWYILLKTIPIIGVIILIILYSSKGDMDKNRFGPSPYKKPDNSFIWPIIGFIFIVFSIILFVAISGSNFLAEKYNNKGITLLKEGKKEVALEAFDKALTYASEAEGLYLNKALALYELERYNDAILACQLAIKINPSFTEAYLIMGNSFGRLKSYKESLDSYNMFLKYEPYNKDALYRKASILMNLERLEEAKETYNKYMLYKDQS